MVKGGRIGQGVDVSHQPLATDQPNTSAQLFAAGSLSLSHTERASWIIMSVQMNDYLRMWVSKETELVKYLSKWEDFGIFKFFFLWQQPARLIKECLWQVISACIHHLTSSVFLLAFTTPPLPLSPLKTLTPSLPKLSVFSFRNTGQTALDSS